MFQHPILQMLSRLRQTFLPTLIFGKISRIASEVRVLQFIKRKFLPILLYGLETWPPKKLILDHWTLSLISFS